MVQKLRESDMKFWAVIIALISTLCGWVWNARGYTSEIQANSKEIAKVYEEGCKPSVDVRRTIVGVEKDIIANKERSLANEKKISDMFDKIDAKQQTIIQLLENMR